MFFDNIIMLREGRILCYCLLFRPARGTFAIHISVVSNHKIFVYGNLSGSINLLIKGFFFFFFGILDWVVTSYGIWLCLDVFLGGSIFLMFYDNSWLALLKSNKWNIMSFQLQSLRGKSYAIYFFRKKKSKWEKTKWILYILDRGVQGGGTRGDGCVKQHIIDFQNLHHFRGTMLEDERRHSSPYLQ